jgi:hypothetical protein
VARLSEVVCALQEIFRPAMDYACPTRKSADCSHVRKLQFLLSKCRRIATLYRSDLVKGKFTRSAGLHFSPTTELCRCGEAISSATLKALVPIKGRGSHLRGTEDCRPVDVAPKKAAKMTQRLMFLD